MSSNVDPAGSMFCFWCPAPFQVRTNAQTYRIPAVKQDAFGTKFYRVLRVVMGRSAYGKLFELRGEATCTGPAAWCPFHTGVNHQCTCTIVHPVPVPGRLWVMQVPGRGKAHGNQKEYYDSFNMYSY
jgi:hypothetical protein